MKNITIAGRTGKDGETRRTGDGKPVLNFSVAVDDGYGQNKSTMWFDVSVWGKRGESLAPIIKKGMALTVTGDLTSREHNGKTYLGVNASEVTLQGGGEKKPARDADEGSYGGATPDLDDEVPFAPEWR
jgi:single-strand DNA-binding protein